MENFRTTMQFSELGMYSGEFYEWLKIDKSFQGWLLTLDDAEFFEVSSLIADYVMSGVENEDIGKLILIVHFRGIPEDGTLINVDIFDKAMRNVAAGTSLIGLARKGLATYVKAEDDLDWRFELTEEGKEMHKKIYNIDD